MTIGGVSDPNADPKVHKDITLALIRHTKPIVTQKNETTNEDKGNLSLANLSLEDQNAKYFSRKLNSIYRPKVMDAYYNRKIFSVNGQYHAIRRALFQRGWIEKLVPGRYDSIQRLNDETLLTYSRQDNNFEAVAIHKVIGDLPAFFVWQFRRQPFFYQEVQPYRNVIRRNRGLDFSTKVGLIACAENEHWFCSDTCKMSYPRFYRLGLQDEDRNEFIEDFRRTQCHNLLRYVNDGIKKSQDLLDRERGTIPFNLYKKAVDLSRKFLTHKEISMTELEWNEFIEESNHVIRDGMKFKISFRELKAYHSTVEDLMKQLEDKYPNFKWDGCRNVWILKPGYWCRGCGIVLKNNLNEILAFCSENQNRRYIAQKYIERPLLIYNTKFDFRLYMLLSFTAESINIWIYRDCYFKFSSQQYSLRDFKESIHLTNNSVQKNYENDKERDVRLPKSNMWSLLQFKQWLLVQGHKAENVWESKIFCGVKKSLTAVVLASMEDTEIIPNSFELYGCDFMMDENFNPILIEINATPDLSPSTEVTTRLCPMVLRDLVKVIVDVPLKKTSTTGLFELVFELNYHFNQNYPNNDLYVTGKSFPIYKAVEKETPKKKPYSNNYTTAFMTFQNSHNNRVENKNDANPVDKTAQSIDSDGSGTKKKKKPKKYIDPSTAYLQKIIRDIHRGVADKDSKYNNKRKVPTKLAAVPTKPTTKV